MFPIYFSVSQRSGLFCIGGEDDLPAGMDGPLVLDYHQSLKVWRRLRQFMKLSSPYSGDTDGWFVYMDPDGNLKLLDEFRDYDTAAGMLKIEEPNAVALLDSISMRKWDATFNNGFVTVFREWRRSQGLPPVIDFHPDVPGFD